MENKDQEKKKRLGNKGFSLVELIVVMAIMVILVGIVGAQVIPYIEKSKESKDYQVMGGFCSAAVSAYTELAESAPSENTTIMVWGEPAGDKDAKFKKAFVEKVQALTYENAGEFKKKMKSDKGKEIKNFKVEISKSAKKITVKPVTDEKGEKETEAFADMVGEL